MNDQVMQVRLDAAVFAAFDLLDAELGAETLYAIALYSDEEHLASTDAKADDTACYRWATAEWRTEGWRNDLFQEIARDIGTSSGEGEPRLEAVVASMQTALANLRSERQERLGSVTLFATVTDTDIAEEIENRTARRVNPTDLVAPFLARYDADSSGAST